MASRGHIRDLAKKGVDLEPRDGAGPSFEPNYEIPAERESQVRELKAAAKKADIVWLASDEDREGEAIAWHLYEVLGLKPEKTRRIVFHEITKDAILNAIEHPRQIDMDRVNAQQARRVLDRIVGFELSPILWRKIKPALSAGRVQSVAVRLIAEREKEISNFRPEPFYRVNGLFITPEGAKLRTELSTRLNDNASAIKLLESCAKATYKVNKIQTKPVSKSPAPPFTTDTLQLEASRKLGFTVSQTMRIAQDLYEAGHITYMRTDSVNLSNLALSTIAKVITDKLGPEYVKTRRYHTEAKGAQEAHEAIRPTYADVETIPGSDREQKLYTLIRRRAIASQMADAQLERTVAEIEISNSPQHFTASGETIKFDGFLRVYMESNDDETDEAKDLLPALTPGEELQPIEITATERFTVAPARYTDATLVKKMKELGIGRPATYATIVSTIQQRDYVERGDREGTERSFEVLTLNPVTGTITSSEKTETYGSNRGKLVPTDIGMIVNDYLEANFPDILDYNFTAQVEDQFDEIASGKSQWKEEIGKFYDRFHPEVDKAIQTRTEHKVGERMLGVHPQSGKPVSVKVGRFGPLVQIGDAEGDEKPQFASLLKGQSIATLTLEEALRLFEYPRVLGDFEDSEVSVAIGRFGPYVKHDGKFTSIPKDIEPAEITLDQAIELIKNKRLEEAQRIIKTFDEEPELQILNGRYGPYIVYKKDNYKIPKTVTDPAALTLEQCLEIINNQPAPKTRKSRAKK